MERAEAIKNMEEKIVGIENGPEEIENYFADGISAYPKEQLPNCYAALEQYKNMSDEQWEKACQFND